ncbi:MAG: hypothetical protein LBK99_19590 [Opitutaceae bacterium]|jgi:hypothetical protein|nr:hypothetical protein [Opitutaceae bacterium]
MRTITLYPVAELDEKFPEGFSTAYLSWKANAACREIPWINEIMDSLKATIKTAGLKITNWQIAPCDGRSYVSVEFDRCETASLSGRRAIAWLENNLLGRLRAPSGIKTLRQRQYGHRAGHIPACPLTGFFSDHDMLDHLRTALRNGETPDEAFSGLAAVASNLMEKEQEDAISENSFQIECESMDYLFTRDGQQVHA